MEQHGVSGGFPITVPMLSNLAHTPNFRASLGQLPLVGVGVGFGIGFGIGGDGVLHALTRTKKKMLIDRKMTVDLDLFESIFLLTKL